MIQSKDSFGGSAKAKRLCTAFQGSKRIAAGELRVVALKVKELAGPDELASILIFDDVTSELQEVDLRGTVEDVLQRLDESAAEQRESEATAGASRGPGRPKLGVVAREVTLLPRHWSWLATQPVGASVALRKLVEGARRANVGRDRERQAREAAYSFMLALAGDEPGFEEATRALFGRNRERFDGSIESWPADVRDHAKKLAGMSFQGEKA